MTLRGATFPTKWPLVGRDREVARLRDALGAGRSAVIVGEMGVGRSRLLAEIVEWAPTVGLATVSSAATEAARRIPLGAFAHLLPIELPGTNVLRITGDAVTEAASSDRFLVAVDDAHLLDDVSAALVHHLAVVRGIPVVATVRKGGPVPHTIRSLWTSDRAERLDVSGLEREELAQFAGIMLGERPGDATVHRLWCETRGNPLLLRESIAAGTAGEPFGTMADDRASVPARLLELVEARLHRLDEPVRTALDVVAVAGEVEAGLLTSIALQEAVEEAEDRGLLDVVLDGRRTRARFTHPLYAEVLRGSMPRLRRRALHEQLASELAASGTRRRDDLLRLVTWKVDAGAPMRPNALIAAARRAAGLWDFRLAERFARIAENEGGGRTARRVLADALIARGRSKDAEAVLAELERSATRPAERVALAVSRATNLYWHLGRPEDAEEVLASCPIDDPHLRGEVAAMRGLLWFFGGRPDEAVDLVRPLLDDHALSDRARVQAAMVASAALGPLGHTREAWEIADRALPLAATAEADLPFAQAWLRCTRSFAALFAGRFDDALEGLEEAYFEAIERRNDAMRGLYGFHLASVELAQGRLPQALQRLRDASAALAEVDQFHHRPAVLAELIRAHALLGEVAPAERTLADADLRNHMSMGRTHLILAEAWTCAARGSTSRAAGLALQAARVAEDAGQLVFRAIALHDAARFGETRRAAAALAGMEGHIDGELIPALAAHASAMSGGRAGDLERASHRFETLGAMLFAAEAAADAAVAHRSAGRASRAESLATRSDRLAARCGEPQTLALRRMRDGLPLTAREREVATLAAQGLSDVEIAERLVVSVRTVGNHLHRCYTKLGVAGRGELRSVFWEGLPRQVPRPRDAL